MLFIASRMRYFRSMPLRRVWMEQFYWIDTVSSYLKANSKKMHAYGKSCGNAQSDLFLAFPWFLFSQNSGDVRESVSSVRHMTDSRRAISRVSQQCSAQRIMRSTRHGKYGIDSNLSKRPDMRSQNVMYGSSEEHGAITHRNTKKIISHKSMKHIRTIQYEIHLFPPQTSKQRNSETRRQHLVWSV